MRINTFSTYLMSGVLVSGIAVESMHVDKAPKLHVPHVEYFSASTNNLSYTVSLATTSGTGIIFSKRLV